MAGEDPRGSRPHEEATSEQPPAGPRWEGDGGGSDPSTWGPPSQQPPADWGPPQPSQQPPADWGPPSGSELPQQPPHPQPGTVSVPGWVGSDWGIAFRIAALGQLILFAAGLAMTIVLMLAVMASAGIDAVDWPAISVTPLSALLGWAGGTVGQPLLVAGVLYTFLAYRLAARPLGAWLQQLFVDRARTVALAAKVGLLAAGLLLAVGILLNSFGDDLIARTPGPAAQASIDLTTLVFFSIFVGLITGLLAILSSGRAGLLPFLGLPQRSSLIMRSGTGGARRTLLVGGIALLLLATLGDLLDRISQPGTGLTDALGQLLFTIGTLIFQWLDTALLLLLGTAKFLHDGGFVWTSSSAGISTWMWLSVPVLLAAYVVGGIFAAKQSNPRTQADAVKAAALVGPAVAAVSLLAAFGWMGQPNIDDIIPVAILLPTLWGVVALAGAWLWANQQQLPSGFSFQTVTQPSAGAAPAPWTPPATPGPSSPAPGSTSPDTSTMDERRPPHAPGPSGPSNDRGARDPANGPVASNTPTPDDHPNQASADGLEQLPPPNPETRSDE